VAQAQNLTSCEADREVTTQRVGYEMEMRESDAAGKSLGSARTLSWVRTGIALILLASALSVGGCALTSAANDGAPASALEIETTTLPQGQPKSAYGASLTASGGKQPYTWKIVSGALPTGLALTSSSGAISGTPTDAGTSSFDVQVQDSSSPINTATASLTISVSSAASAISVSLSPATADVINGATQKFTATVSGGSNAGVTWSLTGSGCSGAACGSLSNSGNSAVYAAPTVAPTPANVVITATSAADSAKQATARVTVIDQISVAVRPANPFVGEGITQQFSATVLGTTNAAVKWSLAGTGCSGAACGTVSSNGLFKAPSSVPSPATVKILATSVADSSEAGSTMITIEGSAIGTPPAAPALPTASVNLTMPTQGTANCPSLTSGSDCVRQVPAGNATSLQSALNAAKCGDTIVLQAGSTYSGNFTIPNIGSCSGWVIVESSEASSLPSGTRVSPSLVSDMATLSGTAHSSVLQFSSPGIHNFRFIGLEISCAASVCDAPNDLTAGLVEIDGGLPSNVSETPDHIIIDRCYIHGTPTQNIRRGIAANGTNIAVVDSYISEIHESGAATGGDSQAIEDWNGAGPLLIQNNFLEAASENIMFGGAGTVVPGLVPSDITIVGNYFYKDPSWRGKAAPYNWAIKNLLEFKNAQRVLVHGNVFAYCWLQAQAGGIVTVTPRAVGGDAWASAADLTFTDNLLEHAGYGITIADSDNNHVPTSQPPQRILIQNNVMTDISPSWGGAGWALLIEDITGGTNLSHRTNWHDLIIDHNDFFGKSHSNCGTFAAGGQGPSAIPAGPIQFINNAMVGDMCGQGRFPGRTSINFYYRNLIWDQNILIDSRGTDYPKRTMFVSKIEALKLEDRSQADGPGTTYQLSPSSPYRNAGTDGADIGVSDWSTWRAATTAAMAGHSK
jgi:hypothetical protein